MQFEMSRLSKGDRIIGASAIGFFIILFLLPWYGVSSSSTLGNFSASATGWESFTNSRWLWLLTIIIAVVYVGMRGAGRDTNNGMSLAAVVAALGVLSVIFVLYRIVDHPSASATFGEGGSASAGIEFGIWLGLIAAAALTYGGYEAMREDGTSIGDVRAQAESAISSRGSGSSAPQSAPPAAPPAEAPASPPPASVPPSPPADSAGAAPPEPPPA